MLSRSLRLMLLFVAVAMPLAGCIIEPYHHHHDDYYRPQPQYAPAPGYYRGY